MGSKFQVKQVVQYQAALNQFSKEFLTKNRLEFFGYDRIYADRTCFRLATDYHVIDHLHEDQNPITAPISKDLVSARMTYLVPMAQKEYDLKVKLDRFSERFKVGHIVDFIERSASYYEQFWFFSSLQSEQAANLYLNKSSEFWSFFSRFRDQARLVIRDASREPLELGQEVFKNSKDIFSGRGSNSASLMTLTQREREYLSFILLGHTALQISHTLGLSIRTVQHYLDNIRAKLGCDKKSELTTVIRELNLVSDWQIEEALRLTKKMPNR